MVAGSDNERNSMKYQLRLDGSADVLLPPKIKAINRLKKQAAAIGMKVQWNGSELDQRWQEWFKSHSAQPA
jgi:hypothetical protein